MSDDGDDFEAEKRAITAQEDLYRERHLNTKLSLYSGFLAFNGLTLAAAALLASRVGAQPVVTAVIGLALLSCLILFFQYDLLLTFYDRMGYPRVTLRSRADKGRYDADVEDAGEYFKRRRKPRRLGDKLLFIIAVVEIILLWCAANH